MELQAATKAQSLRLPRGYRCAGHSQTRPPHWCVRI